MRNGDDHMSIENKRGSLDIKKMVYLAILTALVVILQYVSNITAAVLPVPITLTLVPIVLGSALSGRYSGVWLGFAFGVIVILSGASEPFFTVNPVGTVITVLVKGMASGLVAGLLYSLLEAKNRYLAILVAGIAAPIVNTGLFLVGCFVFFYDYVVSLSGGESLFVFIITAFVGVNFLVELGLNMLLSPTILRILNIKKQA